MRNTINQGLNQLKEITNSLSLFIIFISYCLYTVFKIIFSHPLKRITHSQKWAVHLMETFGFSIKVKGKAPQFPCIYVANHRSYIDIPLILSQIEGVFLAKIEISKWPVIGWGTKLIRTIFVNRESRVSRKAALAQIDQNIKNKQNVILFPEGTTARFPKNNPFRPGVFYLAAKNNYYIVPVTLEYADPADAWIDNEDFVSHFISRFKNPAKKVTLIIGEPVTGSDGERLRQHAQNEILRQITKINESPWGAFTKKGNPYEKQKRIPNFLPLPSGA